MLLDSDLVIKFMRLEEINFSDLCDPNEIYIYCPDDKFGAFVKPNEIKQFQCCICDANYCTKCMKKHDINVISCEDFQNSLATEKEMDQLFLQHSKD